MLKFLQLQIYNFFFLPFEVTLKIDDTAQALSVQFNLLPGQEASFLVFWPGTPLLSGTLWAIIGSKKEIYMIVLYIMPE